MLLLSLTQCIDFGYEQMNSEIYIIASASMFYATYEYYGGPPYIGISISVKREKFKSFSALPYHAYAYSLTRENLFFKLILSSKLSKYYFDSEPWNDLLEKIYIICHRVRLQGFCFWFAEHSMTRRPNESN